MKRVASIAVGDSAMGCESLVFESLEPLLSPVPVVVLIMETVETVKPV